MCRLPRQPWFLLACLALPAFEPATAEPVRRLGLVDRAIAFHGGDLYRATHSKMEICSKSGCFRIAADLEGERFDFLVEGQAGQIRRRVRYTNTTVERWEDGQPVAVAGDDMQRMRDWAMARIYFPFLPFRLNDPSVWKEDLGAETWDGRTLHKVKVTFDSGSSSAADDQYLYWFDPQTGRLEQFAYSYRGDPGGLRFRRAINHRRQGGILFFDQENFGVEGEGLRVDQIDPEMVASRMRHVSTIRLDAIEVEPSDAP